MQSASFQLTRPKRPLAGWVWVVLLHALLLWAVHVGLTRDVVQKMPTVVQALLLSDTRPATPPPAAPPPPTPSPPPPTPQPAKPAPTPAPVAPPVTQAPAAELPAITTPTPTPTGLTASVPATAPAPPTATPVPTPVTAAPTRATAPAPAPTRTAAGVNVNQCEKPEYPSASRRLEEEGTVALRFLVGVDGKVLQSEIEKSSGFKRLDEAARAGLSKCQFRPALVDGKPEQAWASMKITYRLE